MAAELIKFKATVKTALGKTLTKTTGSNLTVTDSSKTPTWYLDVYRSEEPDTLLWSENITKYFGDTVTVSLVSTKAFILKFRCSEVINNNPTLHKGVSIWSTGLFTNTFTVVDDNNTHATLGTGFASGVRSYYIDEPTLGRCTVRMNCTLMTLDMKAAMTIRHAAKRFVIDAANTYSSPNTWTRADYSLTPQVLYNQHEYEVTVNFPYTLEPGTVARLNSTAGVFETLVTVTQSTKTVVFKGVYSSRSRDTGYVFNKERPWDFINVHTVRWNLSLDGVVLAATNGNDLSFRACPLADGTEMVKAGNFGYAEGGKVGGGNRLTGYVANTTGHNIPSSPAYFLQPNKSITMTIISGGGGGAASRNGLATNDINQGYCHADRVGRGQFGGDGVIAFPVPAGNSIHHQTQLMAYVQGGLSNSYPETIVGYGFLVTGKRHNRYTVGNSNGNYASNLENKGESVTIPIDQYASVRVTVVDEVTGYYANTPTGAPEVMSPNYSRGGNGASQVGTTINSALGGGGGAMVTLLFEYVVSATGLAKGIYNGFPIINPWMLGSVEILDPTKNRSTGYGGDAPGLAGGLKGAHDYRYPATHGYSGLWMIREGSSNITWTLTPGTYKIPLAAGKVFKVTASAAGGGAAGVYEPNTFNKDNVTFNYATDGGATWFSVSNEWSVTFNGGKGGRWGIVSGRIIMDGLKGDGGTVTTTKGSGAQPTNTNYYNGTVGSTFIPGESVIGGVYGVGKGAHHDGTTRYVPGVGGGGASGSFTIPAASYDRTLVVEVGWYGVENRPDSSNIKSIKSYGGTSESGLAIVEQINV